LSSLTRQANDPRNFAFRSAKFGSGHSTFQSTAERCGTTVALGIDFVAKPEKARDAFSFLPKALAGALSDVADFAGCLVLSSDQEARLITVITFWSGNDCRQRCNENVRWVRALLSNYVDRYLRVQTLQAHAPLRPETLAEAGEAETNELETGLIAEEAVLVEETASVA